MTILEDRIETPPARPHAVAPAHDEHLAHHFDTARQQFEAAKLGMWLFLATEVLLFGGLFCLYAVFRGNHPEVFAYGSQFLDVRWGALNTVVLIVSSLTMALAVWAAQVGRTRALPVFLLLTLLCAGAFLAIKYVEYSHKFHEKLVWGTSFYETPSHETTDMHAAIDEGAAPAVAHSAETGRLLWMATCRACHGVAGEGIPGQGKDIRGSAFIAEQSNDELVAFIKVGRMPFDPLNETGIQMPPKGGNPILKDEDLRHIVAYVRTFEPPAADATVDGDGESPGDADTAVEPEEAFWVPMSVIPGAPAGPAGLDRAALDAAEGHPWTPDPAAAEHVPHVLDPHRPANAHMFFGIYFLMTGLHGLHVLAGMIVIGWLLFRSLRGHFSPKYFTPVDLGGLYWHVVDVIWIFLFPLLYLIT